MEIPSPDSEEVKQYVDGEPNKTLVQLKYDGIWARVVVRGSVVYIYSKTGNLKASFPIAPHLDGLLREAVLIGEYMYGSQWSQQGDRAGRLYIFDCLVVDEQDISSKPYEERYKKVISLCSEYGQPFNPVPCYALFNLGKVWEEINRRESHEGVIIRRWDSPYNVPLLKLKREVEDDFVVLGTIPGKGKGKNEGRVGSLRLGQYNKEGVIVYVQNCGGGLSDQLRDDLQRMGQEIVGKVVLINGKGRFDSGALRHPNFVRFRDDKLPTACQLKRLSE
jgi:ATP-dependent DNA ligase